MKHEHCPICFRDFNHVDEPEAPEDRRMRRAAVKEARDTIGPFWRSHWREFVALVQTYSDMAAAEKLTRLRESYWIMTRPRKGRPPTPPSAGKVP